METEPQTTQILKLTDKDEREIWSIKKKQIKILELIIYDIKIQAFKKMFNTKN